MVFSFNICTVKSISGNRTSNDKTLYHDNVFHIYGKGPSIAGRELEVEEMSEQSVAMMTAWVVMMAKAVMSSQAAMVAQAEMEASAWMTRAASKGCGGEQRGGERIRLSSSLSLSPGSSSSQRHLAAFLVCLAGGESLR